MRVPASDSPSCARPWSVWADTLAWNRNRATAVISGWNSNVAHLRRNPMFLCPILYVEDEENDVLFMRRALAESGIPNPLHVVPDGKQAIAYLRDATDENHPCFVLLDLNLPLASGFEVLAWIRQQPNLRDLP